MFLINGNLHWSASDLTAAAECEYALLRTLDYKLGWADAIEQKKDPLQEHIGRLGDRHEARLLDELSVQAPCCGPGSRPAAVHDGEARGRRRRDAQGLHG